MMQFHLLVHPIFYGHWGHCDEQLSPYLLRNIPYSWGKRHIYANFHILSKRRSVSQIFGLVLCIVKCQPGHPTHFQTIKIHPFPLCKISTFQIFIIDCNLEVSHILKCMKAQISKLMSCLKCTAPVHT